MKVSIKNFSVNMEIKNKGVEFQVHGHDGAFKGDCYVSKKGLTWCRGKTTRPNGVEVTWQEFIDWMEGDDA